MSETKLIERLHRNGIVDADEGSEQAQNVELILVIFSLFLTTMQAIDLKPVVIGS